MQQTTNPPHVLLSHKSSTGTPIHARSPPTPDSSPPRTAPASHPPAQPESRAESFCTACEDLSSNPDSADDFHGANRLSTVQENRGLGLAFERPDDDDNDDDDDEDNATPTNARPRYFDPIPSSAAMVVAQEDDVSPHSADLSSCDWNTDFMRNVTVRRKRNPKPSRGRDSGQLPSDDAVPSPAKQHTASFQRGEAVPSPRKEVVSSPRKAKRPSVVIVETASPTSGTRTRRTAALREPVEANYNSPITPSEENAAQSMGWTSESRDMPRQTPRDAASKRLSTVSTTSTMVEAMVIATPPRRHQLLRHSGKNMAYRRDVSSPAEFGSDCHSSRNSLYMDDAPLHRLVHKRLSVTDRPKRVNTESGPPGYERSLLGYEHASCGQERPSGHQRAPNYERNMSPALSMRSTRTMDSSKHTLAHQESVRRVLQPAADILSRSSTRRHLPPQSQSQPIAGTRHRRNTSAPESARNSFIAPGPRNFSELSPPQSPLMAEERRPTLSPKPHLRTPASRKQDPNTRPVSYAGSVTDTTIKTLQNRPVRPNPAPVMSSDVARHTEEPEEEKHVPSGLIDRVRRLVADPEGTDEAVLVPTSGHLPASHELVTEVSTRQELSPSMQQTCWSRGRPEDRRSSMHSQDRSSVSPEVRIRPSLDQMSPEDTPRRSLEWRRSTDMGRVSFDLSAMPSEDNTNPRHLYAQGTPFSQMSDTLEVSEATAVSIYPHNNHSLLVVQQVPRRNSLNTDQPVKTPEDPRDLQSTPTPPFVDASETHNDEAVECIPQPAFNVEPSTPPMGLDHPQYDRTDSTRENPQDPPEPPIIMFIPPTPAEELECQLVPGPPKRSKSHLQRQPQRPSNLVQRARRYSGNLITPLLARASINRRRQTRDSATNPSRDKHLPSVTDEYGGTLHPFWRPRGFLDDFEDSDESDEDDVLPSGGDTSDIDDDDDDDEPPRHRRRTLKKWTSGLRESGGFLIGNSLGMERHGSNRRRHHITLPAHFPTSPRTSNDPSSPKMLSNSPTQSLDAHGSGAISKRRSNNSLRSNMSYEAPRRRALWRQGRSLPGIRKYHVQYVGLAGVKENFKERRAEKRRAKLRNSIGSRYYAEPVDSMHV